jgi:hypothetical protein
VKGKDQYFDIWRHAADFVNEIQKLLIPKSILGNDQIVMFLGKLCDYFARRVSLPQVEKTLRMQGVPQT